jgi:acyl carrier protein
VNRTDAEALLERLLHEIAPEIDLAAVDGDALLQDEADLDSMDFLNLVTRLAEQTGIEVPERDYPELATTAGFVDYLVARSDGGAPPAMS